MDNEGKKSRIKKDRSHPAARAMRYFLSDNLKYNKMKYYDI